MHRFMPTAAAVLALTLAAAPAAADEDAPHFTGPYAREILPGVGHNLPQEAPEAFAAAVLRLG